MVYVNIETKRAYGEKDKCPAPYIEVSESEWMDANKAGVISIDSKTKKLVLDIEGLKELKKIEIKIAYDYERTIKNIGIMSTVLKSVIDCRESDVLNMTNMAYMMEQSGISEIDYKLKDNTKKKITLDQLKQVNCELIVGQLAFWMKQDAMKTAVENATTESQIKAIVW